MHLFLTCDPNKPARVHHHTVPVASLRKQHPLVCPPGLVTATEKEIGQALGQRMF